SYSSSLIRPPRRPTLFPYTTLFRSQLDLRVQRILPAFAQHLDSMGTDVGQGPAFALAGILRCREIQVADTCHAILHPGVEQIDVTQELVDEGVGRIIVDLLRAAVLFHPA